MRPPRHPYDPPHQPYAQHSAADGVALTDGSTCFVWHDDRLVETAVSFFREANDWTGRPGPVRIVTREGDFRPDQVYGMRHKAIEHRVGYLEYTTQKMRESLTVSERQLADCRQWLHDNSSEGLAHAG